MDRAELRHLAVRTAEENLRAVSARATRQVVLRRGRSLDMTVGAGFPKSGTVWLCQLLGAALDKPFPRNYQSPVMMAAVVHAHWRYDGRLPPTAYIRRDGRDVMVSLYFHYLRAIAMDRNPRRSRRLVERFAPVWGGGRDPEDVRANLPRFLEIELRSAAASPLPWSEHVRSWWGRPGVSQVSYEGLLDNPVVELSRVVSELGREPDARVVEAAVQRYDFARAAGRETGTEDRTSHLRKGLAGDWVNSFTREAGEVFDALAGDALVELGYAADRHWYDGLGTS